MSGLKAGLRPAKSKKQLLLSAIGVFTEADFKDKGYPLKETRYENNLEFENWTLKRILTENGYIENNKYYFYIKDYLGNNRVVSDQNGVVVQRVSYYPFGMSVSTPGQPYKFAGKELDAMHGLNLYDFHARQQMPDLGIFTSMDPLAEKYYSISPYAYCANNPIKYIDSDGRQIVFVLNYGGKKYNLQYNQNGLTNMATGQKMTVAENSHIGKIVNAYNKMLFGNDKVLSGQVSDLIASENIHTVIGNPAGKSAVKGRSKNSKGISDDQKKMKNGIGIGSETRFDFSDKAMQDFEKTEGVADSEFTSVAHELKHQHDIDQGKMTDDTGNSDAKNPAEKRAVQNENRARKIENLPLRTTYSGKEIFF